MNAPQTLPAIAQVNQLFTQHKKAIQDALPKHITADRMIRIALTELRKTPRLQKCDPLSFLGAVVQASQLGLEPGGALGHCYLIPYGTECQLQIGYRGMVDLARRSGHVKRITATIINDCDEWEAEYGTINTLTHKKPRVFNKNAVMTHVYAVAEYPDGSCQWELMSKEEIEYIRDTYSSGYRRDPKTSPWTTSFDEMAKKTVVRRLFKMLPTSIEMNQAITIDDDDDQKNAKIIDANYEVPMALPDAEKFAEVQRTPDAPLPTNKPAIDADRQVAIEEFMKAASGVKKVGGDPDKILGRKVQEILKGDAKHIAAAADALSLWEPPHDKQ